MRLSLIISFVSIGLIAQAQLITDSQARLKSARSDSKGFLFYQNKLKPAKHKPSSPPPKGKAHPPRTTYGVISFNYSTPRPRYSSGMPLTNISPSSPRYSRGMPLTNISAGRPRYSKDMPLTNISAGRPRYSKGMPLTNISAGTPRYSKGIPLTQMSAPTPRYSPGRPSFGNQYGAVNRFSTKVTFPSSYYLTYPYPDKGSPFKKRYHIYPRYTGSEGFILAFHLWISSYGYRGLQEYAYRDASNEISSYKGEFKLKGVKGSNLHPSSKYHYSLTVSNESIRDGMRKWNVLWNRVYGNNAQPDAVTDKISTPKFDKKEREIWNN